MHVHRLDVDEFDLGDFHVPEDGAQVGLLKFSDRATPEEYFDPREVMQTICLPSTNSTTSPIAVPDW